MDQLDNKLSSLNKYGFPANTRRGEAPVFRFIDGHIISIIENESYDVIQNGSERITIDFVGWCQSCNKTRAVHSVTKRKRDVGISKLLLFGKFVTTPCEKP